MIVPVFVCGRALASFDGRPGYRPQSLVVPGGSELLRTAINGRVRKVLFVPTADPLVRVGWGASSVVKAARSGLSPFQLIEAPFSGASR